MCSVIQIIAGFFVIGSIFFPLLIFRNGRLNYLTHYTKAILILTIMVASVVIGAGIGEYIYYPLCK